MKTWTKVFMSLGVWMVIKWTHLQFALWLTLISIVPSQHKTFQTRTHNLTHMHASFENFMFARTRLWQDTDNWLESNVNENLYAYLWTCNNEMPCNKQMWSLATACGKNLYRALPFTPCCNSMCRSSTGAVIAIK